MTKRRMTAILSTLFVIGIVCLEEWITINLGNPSNAGKIFAGAIYLYISIYIYIDLFRALNSQNRYWKLFNGLCFVRELAIITAVNIVLILIFVILINNEEMNNDITQLIIAGMIDGIAGLIAHKQAIKWWELYKEEQGFDE